MGSDVQNLEIKKRLMFIQGEDYNFLTYNILIILRELKCFGPEKKFKDFRKLAYLVSFTSNYNLANIIQNGKSGGKLNEYDKDLLNRAYNDGLVIQGQLMKLLLTLESKGYICLEKDNNIIDISLKQDDKTLSMFDDSNYDIERSNILIIKSNIQRISILKLENLLKRLFEDYGVKRWAV
jgi:hypothetical protein